MPATTKTGTAIALSARMRRGLSKTNSNAFYTSDSRSRGQSPGNINRAAHLEGAGISGSNCSAGRLPAARAAPRVKVNRNAEPTIAIFRARHGRISANVTRALETRRAELTARLAAVDENSQRHPGYKRAHTLLNNTFRKQKLPQRLAVLQAAAWLIAVLEKLSTLI
jgi:hypothetical protein